MKAIYLLPLLMFAACVNLDDRSFTSESHVITDVISVKPGGFATSDMCFLDTDVGKITARGWATCSLQIGDPIYKVYCTGRQCDGPYFWHWESLEGQI